MSLLFSQQLQEVLLDEGYDNETLTVANWLATFGYPRGSDIGRDKDGMWRVSVRKPGSAADEFKFVTFAEGKSWKKAYQAAMERIRVEAKEKGIKKSVSHFGRTSESKDQDDTGALSKVKKLPAPHMWFIAKTGRDAWVVSIGDPTKSSSKVKRTFHSKDDLKYWVKYEMADQVSPNHVIDRSGLKLVPEFYTQWYVDNMKKEEGDNADLNRRFEQTLVEFQLFGRAKGDLRGAKKGQVVIYRAGLRGEEGEKKLTVVNMTKAKGYGKILIAKDKQGNEYQLPLNDEGQATVVLRKTGNPSDPNESVADVRAMPKAWLEGKA